MKSIHVSVYEDNDKLRGLLELLINNTDGFHITNTYSNCLNVKNEMTKDHPDVVIMDIDMPKCNGINGVRMIKEFDVNIRVLMHTVFDNDDNLFACLTNGADGYLLKRDTSEQLIPAIREVFEGGAPMSPGIARRVLEAFHHPKETAVDKYNITPREIQVLELLARGFSYRMIGIEFSISPETVKRHLKNIYQKLSVQCGPEAVAKAIREKII
ncbi:MAG: response regulator transcription factor [Chryseolinea sp.]